MFRRRFKGRFRKRFKRAIRGRRFTKRVRKIARRTVYALSETKFHYINLGSTILTTAHQTLFPFNGITAGVGDIQRIGTWLTGRRLGVHLRVHLSSAGGNIMPCFRAVLVYPRKGRNTAQAYANMFSLNTLNFVDPSQWIVLKDIHWQLFGWDDAGGANEAQAGSTSTYKQKWFNVKFPYKVPYNTDNTVTRQPMWIFVSNVAGGDATVLRYEYAMRISYKDL